MSPYNSTHTLPASTDAEKGVICSVLLSSVCMESLGDITRHHFHHPSHGMIWNCIVEMKNDGRPIDLVTVTQSMADKNQLELIGGAQVLAELQTFIPTAQNVDCYAGILKEKADARAIIKLCQETQREIHENQNQPTGEIVSAMKAKLEPFQSSAKKEREPRIQFLKPSQIVSYIPESDTVLVGDSAILRGEVFVIGGEPGVGKSTAATELAICGALGRDWLGLKTHTKFRTLIIQNENGRYRLQQEYAARGLSSEIEEHILVSEPPPFGMTLNHPEFLADVKSAIESFKPDVVIFDPWNAAAKDDKARDYAEAFDALRAMLPMGKDKPALGIVAHTKKPQSGDRQTAGSALMHLLSGSYVLASVPRAVFVMLRASTEETDNAIVWCNCKNNNGPLAPRTAWERDPSGFTEITDFDWEAFEGGEGGRKVIRLEHLKSALGTESWSKAAAVERLEKESGLGKRACQKALSEKSQFLRHIEFDGNWVKFKKTDEANE